jgi:hypothetical protein
LRFAASFFAFRRSHTCASMSVSIRCRLFAMAIVPRQSGGPLSLNLP